ncbi:MAG: hypothetical protein E7513_03690 [Ruminococcaceae bacterium]|nr:hypothetical protein [Oscillospiraceae bacterium]
MSKKGKKRRVWAVALVVLIAIAVAGYAFFGNVSVSEDATAEFYYVNDYYDIEITTTLTEEESKKVREMINDGRVVVDNGLSCGFDDSIYLSFDDGNRVKNFYIACDNCPNLKHDGKVVMLSKQDNEELRDMLRKYGAKFPCV